MPDTKSKADKPLPANKQKGKKICTCCHDKKNLTDFYLSYSPMYSLDQRTPICKECCKNSCLNEDGSVCMDKLKNLLRQIDKPLYYDMIASAEASVKKENSYLSDEETKLHGYDILSKYFTLIATRQDRAKSYSDSEKDGFMHQNNNRTIGEKKQIESKYADVNTPIAESINNPKTEQKKKTYSYEIGDFEVTEDLIDLFGAGYEDHIYKKMKDKYEKLKLNYSLQTNIHQEALATYVRFKVQEEESTAKGKVDEAKKWYDAAQNAAEKAKLTPKQLTKADLQGGISSISELSKAIEQATDVIKIMPQFKYRPNDAPDFNIFCYVNYERKLNGQPQVDYEDIYSFYDKKREEYIKQNGDPYGIFSNDTAIKNRETVKTFIKLPDDYYDSEGEADE